MIAQLSKPQSYLIVQVKKISAKWLIQINTWNSTIFLHASNKNIVLKDPILNSDNNIKYRGQNEKCTWTILSKKVHKDVFKNEYVCEAVTCSLMTRQNIKIMLTFKEIDL